MDPGQVVQPGAGDNQPGNNQQPVSNPPTPAPPPPDPTPTPAPPPDLTPVPPPAEPPTSEPPADDPDQQDQIAGAPLFSWKASEYVEHQHTPVWYIVLGAVTLGLMAVLILVLQEWLSAVVVATMAAAIVVYARKTPRSLDYQLQEGGLTIGSKFYPYEEFRSFAVVPHGPLNTVELDPLRRFMPRLSIFFDKDDENEIVKVLENVLPRNERLPDPIDRLSHFLKF